MGMKGTGMESLSLDLSYRSRPHGYAICLFWSSEDWKAAVPAGRVLRPPPPRPPTAAFVFDSSGWLGYSGSGLESQHPGGPS